MITLALITPPSQEQITLQQAKFQLCLDASYITDDDLVTLYKQAPREYVESNCNRAVQSQQFTDKETPHKQRGFLLPHIFCANFVLRFAKYTGGTAT